MTNRKLIAVMLALVLFTACGKSNKVGQGLDTTDKGGNTCRLGETSARCQSPKPSTSQAPGAIGGKSPSPSQQTTAPTNVPPAITVIIPEGQNYEPAVVELPARSVLLVINKDCRPDIKRTYSAVDGTFDSGPMSCNQQFRWTANVIGEFQVKDNSGFPSVGKVTVTP